MKFNNENSQEQMTYVAPKSRLITLGIQTVICGSYGTDNHAGNDLEEDPDRIYEL